MVKETAWQIDFPKVSGSFYDRMLASRQLQSADLTLTLKDMHSCIEVTDITNAVYEIFLAVQRKKKIIILGDYDVDGTMATAELVRFFRLINVEADYYIPDRLKEGYGMSEKSADYIIEKGYGLVITVDNGIAAIEPVAKLREHNISVVITDHHECKEMLPSANAVIDCKRKDSTYPFSELCGAGIVLKLIEALSMEFSLPEDTWTDFIEYAAIATIADVMPLVDENRILVSEGLKRIRKTKIPAIQNLIRVANKKDSMESLSTDDIGYYIAPLINASSRIGDVHVAMDLLLTDDAETAEKKANQLKAYNEERKKIESDIKEEANKSLLETHDFSSVHPVICCGNGWHVGVIGIVASSMVSAYHKPCIILSKDVSGLYHGSCRTYGDISIIDMLDAASEYIVSYGGPKEAAGLKVREEHLEAFCHAVNQYAEQHYSKDMFLPVYHASFEVDLKDISLDNIRCAECFAPFGKGNELPSFVCKDVAITSIRKIGKKEGAENAHIKLTVADSDGNCAEAIGFYCGLYADILKIGDKVSLLFKTSVNEWQGQESAQMLLTDIHMDVPEQSGVSLFEDELFLYDEVPVTEIAEQYGLPVDVYVPDVNFCRRIYTAVRFFMRTESVIVTSLNIFAFLIAKKGKWEISPFKLRRTLEILSEAGYFYFKPMHGGRILLASKECENPVAISQTPTFQRMQGEISS